MLVKEYIFNPENSKYKDMSKEALLKKIDILERYIKHKCNDVAELVKENAFLKHQLEDAVILKVKVGQDVFMLPTEWNGLKEIESYYVSFISITSMGIKYHLSLKQKKKGVEPFFTAGDNMINDIIFLLREDAEMNYKRKKD